MIQIDSRNIVSRIRQWCFAGIDLIFPSRCAGCGQFGPIWCEKCEQAIQVISDPICQTCGNSSHKPVMRCNLCIDYPEGLRVRAYARYQGPVLKAILHLKYRPNRDLAQLMGGWLFDLCSKHNWRPGLIVPVPLGRRRIRRRGYNQANLIAQALAEYLEVELREDILLRTRETKSQVGLDPLERHWNVHQAFHTQDKIIMNRGVLLVDDLVTTGATLSACARALFEAGAQRVYGLAVARA